MQLIIRLNQANAVPIASLFETITNEDGTTSEVEIKQFDWIPALKAAAMEIQALNAYSGTEAFPTPITSNPEAMVWVEEVDDEEGNVTAGHWQGNIEGFLGAANTPPTADRGLVTVSVAEYDWLDTGLIPAMPTTFSFTVGAAPAGKIIQ